MMRTNKSRHIASPFRAFLLVIALLFVGQRAWSDGVEHGSSAAKDSVCSDAQCPMLNAQCSMPNARFSAIAIGATDILDTYLSPERYKGTEFRVLHHVTRQKEQSLWSREWWLQGRMQYAENRAKNGTEIGADVDFAYGFHRRLPLGNVPVSLKAGALADARFGFLYNIRNSNNPAQAVAHLDIRPSVVAEWPFVVRKKSFLLRYEADLPLLGLMFSPNYGQSYYEIFTRGNYDHNIVPTTIGSTPSFRHLLTLDFVLLKKRIRVGWLADWQQSHVNHLKTHSYTHAIVLGIVKN